jgi:hypothetical protein
MIKIQCIKTATFLFIFCLIMASCRKKDDSGATKPGFKEESGTGSNPIKENPTVTGTSTSTNPATQNSSIFTGGAGWSNPTCSSLGNVTLVGINGIVNVTLNFLTAPVTGTYQIASSPGPTACSLLVNNAPNQPAGIVWYGKSGNVVVSTSTNSSVKAVINNAVCTQASFNFPTVLVTGTVGCN